MRIDEHTLMGLDFENGVVDKGSLNKIWTKSDSANIVNKGKYGRKALQLTANDSYLRTSAYNFGTNNFTVEMWIYWTGGYAPFAVFWANEINSDAMWAMLLLGVANGKLFMTANSYNSSGTKGSSINKNTWYHVALVRVSNTLYLYINGKLSDSTSYSNIHSDSYYMGFGGTCGVATQYDRHFEGYIDDFRISNYAKYTSDFTLKKHGLLTSTSPINLLDKTKINGFIIEGIQPANTNRRVIFKVNNVWNKINTSGALVPFTKTENDETVNITDDDVTADYVLENGNTVAELTALNNVPSLAGKLVYPAVALYASEDAEVMPTFGLTVKAEIDTTVNVYSYTTYSQEYAISDGDDVPIVSVVAETETKGDGAVDITARIKANGEWSDYMTLNAVQMKNASAIQLKAVYTVQNTDGSDSAKITGVVIKYNTAGAVTSNSTTEIVTVTQKFTNDLTYVHAYCKHKELIDAKINAYCSIRKQPQKRVQYQVGNGTGSLKTYTLPDNGINQDTLAVYVDGKFISDFGYNTEMSEITLTADKDAVVSASYEYGWEMSDWLPMEQGGSQINDSGNYTTEYTYTIPSHDGIFTVTAVKFELARPEGHVDNETIGTGTGRRQMIRLPHIARKETIVCNGKWSYDYDNQRLTIIAPENEPIVISYDWIAESPKVYSIAAGWAD